MEGDVATWLKDNLSSVLSFPVPQDLISYIMMIDNERDVEDYLRNLLDFENPSHRQFCETYKVIRHFKTGESKNASGAKKSGKNKKVDDLAQSVADISLQNEKGKAGDNNAGDGGKKKKKDKFVNLYSPEGAGRDIVMLKGRHHCDCQSFKHRLVNNCLSCGRIVCAQEGSGPCFFCGELVCSKEEQEFINAKTAQSEKLFNNLMKAGRPAGWEEAVAQRDRLLEYDRTTQKRTRVIDDEGEYFSAGSVWLSKAEREKLAKKEEAEREKKHASRLHAKFTLDFAGRQIVEDNEGSFHDEEEDWNDSNVSNMSIEHPDINLEWKPSFVPSGQLLRESISNFVKNDGNIPKLRVQDKELLEMTDSGACLSMHQPWASLLVYGIKRHEGRTWYSAHRGRLWIAAAAKPPSETEVKEIEAFYRVFRKDENVQFPSHYPTGCLLGCVTVVDCLPQEEYQSRFKEQESESPFVFICADAISLSLKFPIQGQHKIYKLDSQIHKAAQKALMRMISAGE